MSDWSSGDHVWLVNVFTPFGGAQEVLKDLREKVFAGQVVNQLIPLPNAPVRAHQGKASAAALHSWH